MLTKDNVTIGIEWRFGPDWPRQVCSARQRLIKFMVIGRHLKVRLLDNMCSWYFIPIEASEDKERTLVIRETKLSAAMVTKMRRFSNSKGYYWDEEKFYCQREHFDH